MSYIRKIAVKSRKGTLINHFPLWSLLHLCLEFPPWLHSMMNITCKPGKSLPRSILLLVFITAMGSTLDEYSWKPPVSQLSVSQVAAITWVACSCRMLLPAALSMVSACRFHFRLGLLGHHLNHFRSRICGQCICFCYGFIALG